MKKTQNDPGGFKPLPMLMVCIILCCFLWAPIHGGKASAQSVDDFYFKMAVHMLNKGLYLESIGLHQDIIRLSENPESRAKSHLYVGTTYSLYLDQEKASLKHFDTVLKRYPLTAAASDALFNKGIVLYKMNRFSEASRVFRQYVEKYPGSQRRGSAEVWAESAQRSLGEKKPGKVQPPALEVADSTIRVLLKEKAKTLTVSSQGSLTVHESSSEKPVAYGKGPFVFEHRGEDVFLNRRPISCRPCRIVSDAKVMTLDGQRYRGFITVRHDSEGLEAVNQISVEEYLYGVVPQEMPPSWPKEALKAQAVAARTYALYLKSKRRNQPYDLGATTASQVYGGYNSETSVSNAAVDDTKGRVITYDGKLVIAYFHASSGGHTEDARNVWSADIPYLSGIPDRYSANVPNGRWECFMSYEQIRKNLSRYGFNPGRIGRLSTVNTESGRAAKIVFRSERGNLTLSSNDFRIKLGSNKLKSTLFETAPSDKGLMFKGRGFGHGVGMSQWGAKQMAELGYTYEEILNFYYKDVRVVTGG